jgi:replicative DNA helicase
VEHLGDPVAEELGLGLIGAGASADLVLAADRPDQAQGSFQRMVSETDRVLLDARLRFWRGIPPVDMGRDPEGFCVWVAEIGVGTVMVDSLKDVALDLVKDEVGSRVNRAMQLIVDGGIAFFGNHHQRKAASDNKKPKTLNDVYGSNWVTAGCGSVILLWGKPGDPIVELSHLKAPADQAGPFSVALDNVPCQMTRVAGMDVLDIARCRGGCTANDLARALFETTSPTPNEVERARLKLDAHERAGRLVKTGGDRDPATWRVQPVVCRESSPSTGPEALLEESLEVPSPQAMHHVRPRP